MAKTKYTQASNEVEEMVTKLMNTFADRMIHIKRNDLYLCFKDSPKSAYKAKTRLLNGFYRGLTQKKIVIEIWKQGWELDKPAVRALTLYRELYKIDLNDKTKDYKLVKYDLQDFTKILEKVGLHNETVDAFFTKVIA
jgi:hypothetical protein